MTKQVDAHDPDHVRATLEELLRREGIPAREVAPAELPGWLDSFFGGGGSAPSLAYVSLFVLTLLAGTFLVRVLWRASRAEGLLRGRAEGLAPDVRRRVTALRAEAGEAEAAGDLVLALRLLLFALVVGLGEHGDLEFRPAWTNRELLARGAPRPEVRERLAPLLDELDPKTYGSEPARTEDVRRVALLCDELLGGVA